MVASRPPPPDLSNPSRATKQGMVSRRRAAGTRPPTAARPARLPQHPRPSTPPSRPVHAARSPSRALQGPRGAGNPRPPRPPETGHGEGAGPGSRGGGKGRGPHRPRGGILGSGSSTGRSLPPPPTGRQRPEPLPPTPTCCAGLRPAPLAFPPAGWGRRGPGPLPSGRERKVRAGALPVSGSGGSGRGRPAAGRRYLAAPVANFHARTCHTV